MKKLQYVFIRSACLLATPAFVFSCCASNGGSPPGSGSLWLAGLSIGPAAASAGLGQGKATARRPKRGAQPGCLVWNLPLPGSRPGAHRVPRAVTFVSSSSRLCTVVLPHR